MAISVTLGSRGDGQPGANAPNTIRASLWLNYLDARAAWRCRPAERPMSSRLQKMAPSGGRLRPRYRGGVARVRQSQSKESEQGDAINSRCLRDRMRMRGATDSAGPESDERSDWNGSSLPMRSIGKMPVHKMFATGFQKSLIAAPLRNCHSPAEYRAGEGWSRCL